ncbi:MAG: cytochrome c oxidase assembly protein [Paracoccaceae bacterium]
MTPQKKTALILAGIVAVMVSLSFAAVPFYSWFCRVTGFGGTVAVAAAAPDTILDQTITIRFDGSTDKGLPWEFRPMQNKMTLRIGETGLAFYEAKNLSDQTIAGTAAYNVTPDAAGGFFTKIQCFCFTEQVLKPGERVEMPVTFYVDPAMVTDREGKYVHEITLSYTFFEQPLPEDQAALAPAPAQPVN